MILLALAAVAVGVLILTAPKPPFADAEAARTMLAQASRAEAGYYAPLLFQDADSTYRQLISLWEAENKRFFLLRSFAGVRMLARQVQREAQSAADSARAISSSLAAKTTSQASLVRGEIQSFKQRFDHLPMSKRLRSNLSDSELLISECQSALRRRDYKQAFQKCQLAEEAIGEARTAMVERMKNYFANLAQWRAWNETAIAQSRRGGGSAIVVEKMSGTCSVYVSGRLKLRLPVEFGPHWLGEKQFRGDGATPEGQYRITRKKCNGQSKYHKALAINYPNTRDMERFRAAMKNGRLPATARPGGLIEIHGGGGKGTHWTEGCVALTNADIDKVYNLVSGGTPVTIVGSLNDRPELYQE
jgi:L,D-peptidoglycan transpeptidase YkuD (ErfK/YbiS/YcfS/YnhG family)